MKQAIIYLRRQKYFLIALSQTTDGVWIHDQPHILLASGSSNTDLEAALRAAIDGSKIGVPHPRIWEALLDPLFQLAGVKTWNRFAKGALCVQVQKNQQQFIFTPTRNLGPDRGFVEDLAGQSTLDGPPPGALALAVKKAFLQCS